MNTLWRPYRLRFSCCVCSKAVMLTKIVLLESPGGCGGGKGGKRHFCKSSSFMGRCIKSEVQELCTLRESLNSFCSLELMVCHPRALP